MNYTLANKPKQWKLDKLNHCPQAGAGVNRYIFHVACLLAPHYPTGELHQLLTNATANCGRNTQQDIAHAIANVRPPSEWRGPMQRALEHMEAGSMTTVKRWPAPDWKLIRSIAERKDTIQDLAAMSPNVADITANECLDLLWPNGDPYLCVASAHPHEAHTKPKSFWQHKPFGYGQGLGGYGLIVPSRMTAPTGINQEGEKSSRCLNNTAARGYLVVEFDFVANADGECTPAGEILASMAKEPVARSAPDLCAGIAIHLLAEQSPLILAVHSGGKSIHLWFPAYAASDEQLTPFFESVCRLGADPATWTKCQLVRMPGGTRWDQYHDTGIRQRILYLNKKYLPIKIT